MNSSPELTPVVRMVFALSAVVIAVALLLKGASSPATAHASQSPATPQEERQLEDLTPKHIPIKVKIKAEKEKLFKDLNNEHWLRDLEIEVKNTGNKPIYFLVLVLDLPETKDRDGNLIGWDLHYGRTDLISITAPLKPEDIPIRPGETYVFTVAERFVKGFERIVREDGVVQPKKVRAIFQFVNFGDGTGFSGTGNPLPHPKRAANTGSYAGPKRDSSKDPTANWPNKATHQSTKLFSAISNQQSAGVLGGIFLTTESSSPITVNAGAALLCPVLGS
jgi:hypothetical protein